MTVMKKNVSEKGMTEEDMKCFDGGTLNTKGGVCTV